jgi:hypothetical protein
VGARTRLRGVDEGGQYLVLILAFHIAWQSRCPPT